jgi:hypothetical protein
MPKLPIDYSNTIIYKLCCLDPTITEIYIGHTTDFKARKNLHKGACNNENSKSYNIYVYQFIRENGGWTNWTMVLIEEIKCNNKLEACKVERKYIEELQASLNKVIPTRTKEEINQKQKEYHELHKEELNQYQREYRELHKEEIKQYQREYDALHKEELNQKSREYNELHKEELKQYQKEYKKLHKEEINQKQRDRRLQKKLQMV